MLGALPDKGVWCGAGRASPAMAPHEKIMQTGSVEQVPVAVGGCSEVQQAGQHGGVPGSMRTEAVGHRNVIVDPCVTRDNALG